MLDTPPHGDPGFATKSELAYTRVRALILSGELAPGAVLPQTALAQQIGISTTPLREALRRLKQEGLVELDAHRDARVRPLDAAELAEQPLGVRALAAFPRKSERGLHTGQVGRPVVFAGVTFYEGAWLCADSDGIVVLPQAP